MSVVQKILGNTFAQVFGKVATAFVALGTVKVLSGYFSASEFGDYGTVYEFLAFFGALADMGIYTLVLREMSKYQDKKEIIFGNAFTLRLLLTTIAMFTAVGGAVLIPTYMGTYIPHGVALAAVATFFVLMGGTVSVVLQLHWKMKFHSYALVFGKIITFFLILWVTKYLYPDDTESGFFAVIIAGIIGMLLYFLMTYFFTRSYITLRPSFDLIQLKGLFLDALPFGISMILSTLYFRMGFLLLGFLLPRSDDGICSESFCGDLESGKYYIAVRMMEVLLLFPIFFMNSVLPHLSQKIAQKNADISKILSSSFLFLFFLGFPIAIGGMILSTPITALLADSKLLSNTENFGSDTAYMILSLPLFFAFITTFLSFSLISLDQQKKVLQMNFYALVLNIISNILLIPQYGLVGAAVSALISELLLVCLGWFFLYRFVDFIFPWKGVLQLFFATLAMGVCTYFVFDLMLPLVGDFFALLCTFTISGILFFIFLWKISFFTPEMKRILPFFSKKK